MKSLYILQPYHVGSKRAKSLAVVIPAKVVKEYNIDASTVFALRTDEKTKRITLQSVNEIAEVLENIKMSAGESFQASSQQTSSNGVQ